MTWLQILKIKIKFLFKNYKKFQAMVKELLIRCGKSNISLVFITQSYFSVPVDVRLIQHIIWSWK